MRKQIVMAVLPAVLLSSGVALALPAQAETVRNRAVMPVPKQASPREVFTGVFFGAGELGKKLEGSRNQAITSDSELRRAQDELLKKYETAFPQGVDHFYQRVKGGSLTQVRSAIVETSAQLAEALDVPSESTRDSANGKCLVWALALTVAISVYIVVNIDKDHGNAPNANWARTSGSGTNSLDRVSLELYRALA